MNETKKLNVFFLPAWYPNPDNQIAGKFVIGHARAIQDEVKQLSVFYVYPYKDADQLFKQEVFSKDGINHLIITHRRFDGLLFPISVLLYVFSLFYGYVKAVKLFGKPDINHVHVLARVGLLAFVMKYIYKIPYVITEHWSRYLPSVNKYHGVFRKKTTSIIARKSDGLSAVSENLLMALRSHQIVNDNSMVIRNAIDTDFYKPVERQRLDYFKFLHVSGLEDEVKNVSGILAAVKELNNLQLDFQLHVVGDYADRVIFEKYAKDHALNNVFFYGELYGEDLLKHYQTADAFVLFSNYENLPCVLLEAICVGMPIISSKVGGTGEIVNVNNGLLVKPKDEKALALAMQKMITDRLQYDSTLIRHEAIQKYAYKSVGQQILMFYGLALNHYHRIK